MKKIKLSNNLTIICNEHEEIGKTTGTQRKFSIVQIKDGKKEIAYLSKLLEINGQAVNEEWKV